MVLQSQGNDLFFSYEGALAAGSFFGEDKAAHSEDRAENGKIGDVFSQNHHGGDHGDGGLQINIDAGLNGAQHLNGIVPGEEANCRCADAEIKQIQYVLRSRKGGEGKIDVQPPKDGNHEQQAVEKNLAGGTQGVVAQIGDFFGDYRIKAPDNGGAYIEQIPQRVQLHSRAVKADQQNPDDGNGKADKEIYAEPCFLAHQRLRNKGSENRRRGNHHSGIGGVGVGEGDILQGKIKGDAAEPGQSKKQLMAFLFQPHRASADDQQCQKADNKAIHHDLYGMKAV